MSFIINPYRFVAPGGSTPSLTWGGTLDDLTSTTTYNFSANIGTASADRVIIVGIHQLGGTSNKTVTGTVNGVAIGNIQQGSGRLHLGYCNVTSGSGSQTIALTFSSAPSRCSIGWWILTGANTTHTDVQSSFNTTDASRSVNMTVPASGVCAVVGTRGSSTAITTTNATEDYDTQPGSAAQRNIGAHTTSTGAITVTFADVSSIAGFAFGP